MPEPLTPAEIAKMRALLDAHPPTTLPPPGMPEWDVRRIVATLEGLEAQAGAMRAALTLVEWGGTDRELDESACPRCGFLERAKSHRDDCALAAALTPTSGQHAARILALVAEWERANAEHYAYWQAAGYSPAEREREAELRERVHDVQIRLLEAARETP